VTGGLALAALGVWQAARRGARRRRFAALVGVHR
jgi:hypothetical protein